MRIIGGQFRSRLLVAPQGNATRPTSDRLRETLFNVLGSRVLGSRFADLYAGSGAVGLEALSRGAASCLFAERAASAISALRKNLASLEVQSQARLETRPVHRVLQDLAREKLTLDLIFLDPPYEDQEAYGETLRQLAGPQGTLLQKNALVIAEHAKRNNMPQQIGGLVRSRLLEQGDAALSFYAVRDEVIVGEV